MVKIADSAAIRQYMPTGPRAGSSHGTSLAGVVFVCSIMTSLVLPIGIFRMLEVPKRTAALDLRKRRKVICRRGGGGGPFERPGVPGVAASHLTPPDRPKQVARENQHRHGLDQRADG